MRSLIWLQIAVCLVSTARAQTREEVVRGDRKKVEAAGFWIYNDPPKAFAEAKRTGKPIIVVLRCLPCHECVKLDVFRIAERTQSQTSIQPFKFGLNDGQFERHVVRNLSRHD